MSQRIPNLPPAERRAWVRYPCSLDLLHRIIDAETECGWWATVLDVSRGGIGLRLPQRIEPGVTLILERPARHGRPGRALPVRVVASTAAAEGGWRLGCQFVYPLSEQDMEALLQPAESRTAGCAQPVPVQSFAMPAGPEV
jgi:hypothetical protein